MLPMVWLFGVDFFGGVVVQAFFFFNSQLHLPRSLFWNKPMPGIRQKLELHGKRKRHDQSQGLQEGQNLSKKLLQLWSLGKLSSSGLQELASAAASDGLQHEEVMQQNAIGTFGQYPNNCHRDLLRLLKN